MSAAMFLVLMLVATALGFVKLFLLADLLPQASFARYSAYLSMVALPAGLISFGLIEGTVKHFTRLVADGQAHQLRSETWRINIKLGYRLLMVSAALAVLSLGLEVIPLKVALAMVLLMAVTLVSGLTASGIRAHGALGWLVALSLTRGLTALAMATLFGYAVGWETALLMEGLGSLAVVLLISVWFNARETTSGQTTSNLATPEQVAPNNDSDALKDGGGRLLFWAFLLGSLPLTVDRWFILTFDHVQVSSQYAFLAIWIFGANGLVGILAQKIGPDIVKAELDKADIKQVKKLIRTTALFSLAVFISTIATMLALNIVFPTTFWEKYELTTALAVSVAIAAALQMTHLVEWLLISFDRELDVLASSIGFLLAFTLLFTLVAVCGFGTIGYIWAFVISRLVHVAFLSMSVRKAIKRRKDKAGQ